jgi:hypothetical protein
MESIHNVRGLATVAIIHLHDMPNMLAEFLRWVLCWTRPTGVETAIAGKSRVTALGTFPYSYLWHLDYPFVCHTTCFNGSKSTDLNLDHAICPVALPFAIKNEDRIKQFKADKREDK